MLIRTFFAICATVITLLPRPVHALGCPPFSEELVNAYTYLMEGLQEAFQQGLFEALSSQEEEYSREQISAIKVVASQVATAAKAQINAATALKQGELAAVAQMETTKELARITADYSSGTGQGTDPCAQLAAQRKLAMAGLQTSKVAEDMLIKVDNGPGKYRDPESFTRRATDMRKKMFATEDEEKLGYGSAVRDRIKTVDGREIALAGADTNASILFADSDDMRIQMAKDAFLNNIAGTPDPAISKEIAQTPQGKRYLAEKQRKDALMSLAMQSLSTVAAENSPNKEVGVSEMEAMRKVVSLYYGNSPEAKIRWQGWTVQSQRGLMVDELKMKAVELHMLMKLYQQGQRHEALLGGQLAVEAGREYNRSATNAASVLQSGSLPR